MGEAFRSRRRLAPVRARTWLIGTAIALLVVAAITYALAFWIVNSGYAYLFWAIFAFSSFVAVVLLLALALGTMFGRFANRNVNPS